MAVRRLLHKSALSGTNRTIHRSTSSSESRRRRHIKPRGEGATKALHVHIALIANLCLLFLVLALNLRHEKSLFVRFLC